MPPFFCLFRTCYLIRSRLSFGSLYLLLTLSFSESLFDAQQFLCCLSLSPAHSASLTDRIVKFITSIPFQPALVLFCCFAVYPSFSFVPFMFLCFVYAFGHSDFARRYLVAIVFKIDWFCLASLSLFC